MFVFLHRLANIDLRQTKNEIADKTKKASLRPKGENYNSHYLRDGTNMFLITYVFNCKIFIHMKTVLELS